MQEATPMQMVQRGADVNRGAHRIADLEPSLRLPFDDVEQRCALEVLERQIRQTFVLAHAVHVHDVRMSDCAQDARFTSQRRHIAALMQAFRRNDLAGERAPVARAPHLVQMSGASSGEVTNDSEVTVDAVTHRIGKRFAMTAPGTNSAPQIEQAETSWWCASFHHPMPVFPIRAYQPPCCG